jgi:hypothetical protein
VVKGFVGGVYPKLLKFLAVPRENACGFDFVHLPRFLLTLGLATKREGNE